MSILTGEEITNLYLYGSTTTPENLTDESLIRPKNTPPLETSVNGNIFMQTGPGRFALPVLWEVVNEFFDLNRGLQPGTYTEQRLRQEFGISENDATKDLKQYNYDDGLDNYAERVYIWNSGSYEIDDSAVFVVDENGNRHIEHFAVIPLGQKGAPHGSNGGILDNFDFEGGGLAQILNNTLEQKIDPSGIGIKVNIEITNVTNFRTYTIADFVADTQKYNAFNVNTAIALLRLADEGYDLVNQIFDSGVTKFLDPDNKPILYGSDQDDSIFGTQSRTHVDIGADNHPLNGWVQNGIRYIGGAGNDTLVGTDYDDKLLGDDDNDLLDGLSGNDYLEGGKGNDRLVGEDGFDTYVYTTGDGFDTLLDSDGLGKIQWDTLEIKGSTGLAPAQWKQLSPTLWRDETNHITYDLKTQADGSKTLFIIGQNSDKLQIEHWVDGNLGITLGAGTPPPASNILNGDQHGPLTGAVGAETYNWSATSWAADGALIGGVFEANFNDVIYATSSDETLNGLGGNDALDGGAGNDQIDGGIGDDLIGGGAGSDTIRGGTGNDVILSATGLSAPQRQGPNNVWQVPSGRTVWTQGSTWGVGIDANNTRTIYGGGSLTPDTAADIIFAGDGDDIVIGGLGDDYIDGGLNNDMLWGHGGNDIIDGGEGDDYLQGDGSVSPGIYQSVLAASHGNDFLDGGAGADTLLGGGGDDTLIGGSGNDILQGDDTENNLAAQYHGNDFLDGGAGNDNLHGDGGNDSIYGGGDNDTLSGGSGNDILYGGADNDILDGGEGNDTLTGGAGADTLQGGAGDDTYLDLTAEDTLNDTQGKNVIRLNQVSGLAAGSALSKGDQYGIKLNIALDNGETITLTNALFGMNATLVFAGGAETDLETLVGNQLSTAVSLQLGANGGRLYGGASDDTLLGSSATDVLSGHKGDDILQGRLGDDIYEYALGDGRDTIVESGGNDVLRFNNDINPQDVKLVRSWSYDGEDGLQLELPDMVGQSLAGYVHINNYFLLANDTNRVERIEFADGTTWRYEDIQQKLLKPTEGNDVDVTALSGFAENDVIDGLGGNDAINGKAGNDTLLGGNGDDNIQGGLGDDMLMGGAGDDRLFGYGFWLSDTYIVNNDTGNDVLDGGAGDDELFGGQGNDTYLFGRGDGYDQIGETPTAGLPSVDTLRLKAGVLPEHVTLHRIDSTKLLIAIDGTNTQVLLDGYFSVGDNSIERIEFDNGNGPVWTTVDIASHVEVGTQNNQTGTAADDIFVADHEQDLITEAANSGIDTVLASRSFTLSANIENLTLTGYLNINAEGNDLNNTLVGNVGDNIITGGNGLDIGYGGLGNDRYYSIEDIVEYAGEGIDTWIKAYGGTLPDNVENLYMHDVPSYGSGTAIGNGLNNILTSPGNGSFNNVLDGRGGADTMVVKGWDSVIVYIDNPGDKIIAERQGPYEIRSYIDYVLSEPARYASDNQYIRDSVANRLVLLGESATNGTGNPLDNFLDGSQNLAANTLLGGQGNDRYVIGAEDAVVELPGEGFDTVEIVSTTPFTYLMEGRNVERVSVIGSGRGTIEGSGSDDIIETSSGGVLIGGQGNDTLKAGHDATLIGGLGNDSYYLSSNLPLTIIENPGEGIDKIFYSSSYSHVMPENIEEAYAMGENDGVNITGNTLNNRIEGNSGRNWINGGLGADVMIGGRGSDWYKVNDIGDQVIDKLSSWADDGAFDQVDSSVDFTLPDFVEHLNLTGSANLNGTGNSLNNFLMGNDGNNILTGLAGSDQLTGGLGDDTLIGGSGNDTYFFSKGSGHDIINSYDLTVGKVDAVQFSSGIMPSEIRTGRIDNDLVLSIVGTTDTLTIQHYFDNDGITPYSVEEIRFSNYPINTVWNLATINAIMMITNQAPVVLTPISDLSVVEGTPFQYVIPANTFTDDLDPAGLLTYSATLSDGSPLPYWINFYGTYFSGRSIGTGSISIRVTAQDTGNLTVSDTFDIATYYQNLTVTGTALGDSGYGGSGNDILYGLGGNDYLFGYEGNDTVDGGTGGDGLYGGLGNDIYLVDSLSDYVSEYFEEGIDLVQSSVTWTLSDDVENLTLTGSAANGTGNALDNVLTGNTAVNILTGYGGNDRLIGGAGKDTMQGGTGNDTYVLDIATDIVTENLNEGTDTVEIGVTYTLGNNVENLTLTGASAINATGNTLNNVLTGNSAVNTLTGGAGNDRLDGKGGADKMLGGTGDDIYVVDVSIDVLTENANEGSDTVETGITYTLGANIENLLLIGTKAINGTGNTLNNILTGNSAVNTLTGGAGNDRLDGKAGADKMLGGTGDDIYVVDVSTDVITEKANEGIDTVETGITYTLGSNLENLTLIGTAAINGTGNTLNNIIIGNSAANTLNGGLGIDRLAGGLGDDTYVVDNVGDTIVENVNSGIDTVESSVTLTLGSNLENLTLTGTAAINGTGNIFNNVLKGNSMANSLSGGDGNDTLEGLVGTDTLTGGSGNDTYILGRSYGTDTVVENDATAGNTDIAQFLSGVTADQIWFQHVSNSNNLEASIIGTNDKLVIKDWYLSTSNHVEQFKTTDGAKTLIDSNVQNLVSQMANFNPPAAGQSTLPQNYQTALAPVIAANWQ